MSQNLKSLHSPIVECRSFIRCIRHVLYRRNLLSSDNGERRYNSQEYFLSLSLEVMRFSNYWYLFLLSIHDSISSLLPYTFSLLLLYFATLKLLIFRSLLQPFFLYGLATEGFFISSPYLPPLHYTDIIYVFVWSSCTSFSFFLPANFFLITFLSHLLSSFNCAFSFKPLLYSHIYNIVGKRKRREEGYTMKQIKGYGAK